MEWQKINVEAKINSLIESLSIQYDIPCEKFEIFSTTPLQWFKNTINLGIKQVELTQMICRIFEIPTLDYDKAKNNVDMHGDALLVDGVCYVENLDNRHFFDKKYGLIVFDIERCFCDTFANKLLVDVILQQEKIKSKKDLPEKISIDNGVVFYSFNKNKVMRQLLPLRFRLFVASNCMIENDLTDIVWKSVDEKFLSNLKKTRGLLHVISGDNISGVRDKIEIMLSNSFEFKVFSDINALTLNENFIGEDNVILIDEREVTSGLSEDIKNILSNKKANVILFFRDIFNFNINNKLKKIVGLDFIYKELATLLICKKFPVICDKCSVQKHIPLTVGSLSYNCSFSRGDYLYHGRGCDCCSGGYSGWVVANEHIKNMENYLNMIEAFEKSNNTNSQPSRFNEVLKEYKQSSIVVSMEKLVTGKQVDLNDVLNILV